MLKFLEIGHNLSRQKSLLAERQETLAAESRFSMSVIRNLLGLGQRNTGSSVALSAGEIQLLRKQSVVAEEIFKIFRNSVEIMDEVDIILHPLKSELNWPLGSKEPLDFTRSRSGNGLRWSLPSHLLDAIFSCCGMPILADIADSRASIAILDELQVAIQDGFATLQMQKSPHLALVSKNFYDSRMKGVLAKWLVLWLRARKLPTLLDDEIVDFLLRGNVCNTAILDKMKKHLLDDHIKMMNLGHDWLNSFLPFVLQKVNRVHFGLLQPKDVQQLEDDGVKIPTSRKLVAVPFVAKDVPSRASEFAHPDVLIGLTILAYRYEGLRKKDFALVLRHLKEMMDEEGGLYKDRPACQKFETWVLCSGKAIRGSKKREKTGRRATANQQATGGGMTGAPKKMGSKRRSILTMRTKEAENITERQVGIDIFADIFSEEDDLIWPLQLVDLRDKEQFKVLYPLLYKLPHTVMHYLNEIIFPEVLAHQGLRS